ncbi:MAG: TlpA family protein disulfide reductase [Alphaproteobacteria bacterium]|nr:TlpA family protein disulfide reductase [Alphaproteobacteria bacterium]
MSETTVQFDGAALAAEIERARDDFEAKKRVLEKAFAGVPSSMITVDVLDAAGQPTDRLDRGLVRRESIGSQVRLTVPIRLSLDVNVWNDSVRPALDRVMVAAADRTMRTSLTLQGLQGSAINVSGDGQGATSSDSTSGKSLAVGDQAPTLRGAASVQGPISEVPRGRVGVVLFWATWSGTCKKALPILAQLHENHRDDGLAVIGVSGEKAEVVSRFLQSERASIPFSVLADADGVLSSRWMKASGRDGIPCVFLVSSGGEVAWMGHPADPGLSGRVRDLLASTEPKTSDRGRSVMIREATRRVAGAAPASSVARVALLSEMLRGGRQMVFDEFELDAALLPWSERGGLDMVPPMVVRVRLRDAQGEVVDGSDLDLAVSTPSGVRFGWRRAGPSESAVDPGPWPLYADAQPQWFGSVRGSADEVSTTIVWPFWFSNGLVDASIETEVELEIDRRDLERVATIEVDLASR